MLCENGKRTRDFFEAILFFLKFSLLYFGGVFNETTRGLEALTRMLFSDHCWFVCEE